MKKKTKTTAKKAAAKRAPAAKQTRRVVPIPAGYHSITPHLVCNGAGKAIDFYKKAFGAKERMRMPAPDGSVAHAEITIGNSIVMLGDEVPQMGVKAPQTIGGTPVNIFIYTENVDKLYAQATAAGATGDQPPTNMFWGDRYAKLTDPFGHKWSMATHVEDVSPKEMGKRSA